jgi:diadenosine tetraphosphatase ApaH/serine/threonine PP2A family protein phosphatase
MRFAILGDIHANLHALHAVLADASAQGITHHACMGDIVGYCAYPKECVEMIRELDCPTVKGNHDEQISKEFFQEGLNPLAEESMAWTRSQLTPADLQWLRELRMQRLIRDFTIVHATLDTPHKWGYVYTELDAAACFSYQRTGICFIGHTHVPIAYAKEGDFRTIPLDILKIDRNQKYLINVGSVGQPRDLDWRAAYCIYDAESQEVELRRVEYDLRGAQAAILAAGLPEKLATRLEKGR